MEPKKTDPGERQLSHPTPEIAADAVKLLNAATTLCCELDIDVSIGVHDLPRDAFDVIDDYRGGNPQGYVIAPDPENPMWWKHAPGRIHVYTREPPKLGNDSRGEGRSNRESSPTIQE